MDMNGLRDGDEIIVVNDSQVDPSVDRSDIDLLVLTLGQAKTHEARNKVLYRIRWAFSILVGELRGYLVAQYGKLQSTHSDMPLSLDEASESPISLEVPTVDDDDDDDFWIDTARTAASTNDDQDTIRIAAPTHNLEALHQFLPPVIIENTRELLTKLGVSEQTIDTALQDAPLIGTECAQGGNAYNGSVQRIYTEAMLEQALGRSIYISRGSHNPIEKPRMVGEQSTTRTPRIEEEDDTNRIDVSGFKVQDSEKSPAKDGDYVESLNAVDSGADPMSDDTIDMLPLSGVNLEDTADIPSHDTSLSDGDLSNI